MTTFGKTIMVTLRLHLSEVLAVINGRFRWSQMKWLPKWFE